MTLQPHVRCYTRALKNARHLQKVAPDLFAKDPSLEGFGTGVPMEILRGLHRIRHDSPILSRYQAVAETLRKHPLPSVGQPARDALFQGTVHFAQLTFHTSTGDKVMSTSDMNQIVQYATHAVAPISEYALQYGPNAVNVAATLLTKTVNVPSATFTDDDLRGWVNALKSDNNLPDNSCVFVVVPAGISAANVGGDAGYHQKADIPYIVVGVTSTGLTLADVPDVYAMGVSHEIAEVVVDPNVGGADPEVCDPCDINCPPNLNRDYFDAQDNYLGSNQAQPPAGFNYAYYICAIVKPAGVSDCPASSANCNYAPVEPMMASPISLRQFLVCKNIDPATGLRSHFSPAALARGLRALVVSEPPAINAFIVAPSQISSGGSVTIEWRVRSCCPLPLLKIRITQKNFHTKEVLAVHNGLAANGTLMDSPQVDSIYYLDASCEGGAAASPFERSVAVTGTPPPNWQPFCFKVENPDDPDFCRTGTWWAATQSDAEAMVGREYPPNQGYVPHPIDCSEVTTACGG